MDIIKIIRLGLIIVCDTNNLLIINNETFKISNISMIKYQSSGNQREVEITDHTALKLKRINTF